MRWNVSLALLLAAAAAPPLLLSPAQDPRAKRDVTPQFHVADGLEVTLWAESPQLYNPTAIDFDERGRLWVTEAVNYRRWDGRNPGLQHPAGDRVVILEDTDGDGVCDTSKVFVEDKELVSPLGICVLGPGRILVSCSPNAILYTDTDGDDKADTKEVFLAGFGGHDHDHGLHSFVPAPDGWLYGCCGNAGPHLVTDKSGWHLRSGSVYNGGGAAVADNKPGLVSDDGRIWTGGLAMRVRPDGKNLQILAHNFRNEYEIARDSFGNLYTADNDDDGNEGCRTLWVMEGGNYGFFSTDGSRDWTEDRRPGQNVWRSEWRQDDPGVVPAGCQNGSGGPTGVAIYEAPLIPGLEGAILNCDAGRNVVYAHRPVAIGAGIALEPGKLIESRLETNDPKARWFRPSDVCVAHDGSIFVADWWDPGVGGHAAGDKECYGRILRIGPKGSKPKPTGWNDARGGWPVRLAWFASPVAALREKATHSPSPGPSSIANFLSALADEDEMPWLRARAIAALAAIPNESAALEKHLHDANSEIRIATFRALRAPDTLLDLAQKLVRDPSPAVRREVAISLRDVPFAIGGDLLVALARQVDPSDRYAVEALGIGAQGKEEELWATIAGKDKDRLRWSPFIDALTWRLHPKSAIPTLTAWANDSQLSREARMHAVTALAFIQDRTAADAVLSLALVGPEDTRETARWWIRHRDTNDWREYGLGAQVAAGHFDKAKKVWSSGVLRRDPKNLEVDVTGASVLWLVVTDGGDGNSCDWSDWVEPRLVVDGAERKLTELPWLEAACAWGQVNLGKNCSGGPLKVAGKLVPGIGTHANSKIAYALPAGATRFLASVGPDDGGVNQAGGHVASIEFQVFTETPPDRKPFEALQKLVLDAKGDLDARKEAAEKLASDLEGGVFLLRLAEKGTLDAALAPTVAAAIPNNPDLSVRALSTRYFPRAANGGDKMPPLSELAAMEGDPRRGQAVFLGGAAACVQCHTFRGRGAAIGPDLTSIRTKYGKLELLDAILNPSAAIAFGYDTWLVSTKDGRSYCGFLVGDGENVVLKDTQGKRVVIPAKDIEEKTKQKISAMPEGLALGMTPQQLADLGAFLSEDPARAPKLGPEIALWNGRDFAGWTYHLSDPKKKMEEVWSIDGGEIVCKGNPVGYIRTTADYTNFVLTLDWRFDPKKGPGNSGVLLRMVGKDKVWPKSVEAQLMSRDAGDIWDIDDFPILVDPARTDGRRTVKLQPCNEKPLGEWNHYEITLDHGELRLVVNGELQNRASWVDEVPGKICLQSEGAEIHFRNIRLRPIVP